MRRPPDATRPKAKSRAQMLILACLTALGAAIFTVAFFDVLTPPLDTATLLKPPPARPTAVRPTATVLPSIPRLFLEDDFSTRDNWPTVVGNALSGYTENGYLLAPAPDVEFMHVFLQNFNGATIHDLSVQVEANAMPGSSGVNYGAFFWHSQDKDGQERFLYFGVNTNGMYTLRASVPVTRTNAAPGASRWVDLVPETPSPSINKGGAPNRLRVDAHPHRILAFINGSLVFDRDNPDVDAYRSRDDFDGRVGLLAFSLGKPNSKAIFTQFDFYADQEK